MHLTIGQLAQRVGIAPSALRYYEKAGLLPAPARASKRRQYDPDIVGRVGIILLAREAGFSVQETRFFLSEFPTGSTPALRWREMAQRKLAELDRLLTQVNRMKLILNSSFNCTCRHLRDCERLLAEMPDNIEKFAVEKPKTAHGHRNTAVGSASRKR